MLPFCKSFLSNIFKFGTLLKTLRYIMYDYRYNQDVPEVDDLILVFRCEGKLGSNKGFRYYFSNVRFWHRFDEALTYIFTRFYVLGCG